MLSAIETVFNIPQGYLTWDRIKVWLAGLIIVSLTIVCLIRDPFVACLIIGMGYFVLSLEQENVELRKRIETLEKMIVTPRSFSR